MPPALSAHARGLAVVLEVLALLALVSGSFPTALSSPIWWLRCVLRRRGLTEGGQGIGGALMGS
jgi:hypothetical protein